MVAFHFFQNVLKKTFRISTGTLLSGVRLRVVLFNIIDSVGFSPVRHPGVAIDHRRPGGAVPACYPDEEGVVEGGASDCPPRGLCEPGVPREIHRHQGR